MKTIRFWTSRDEKDGDYWRDWFCLPAGEYEFVFDKVNPDYLFVSEHIYSRPSKFREFLRMNTESRLSVYIGGEAISPDLNLFDYACSFDRGLVFADRIIRKPTTLFFKVHVFESLTEGVDSPRDELRMKKGFCNFIYSNPSAHKRRDELFDVLSHYKRVDSLGPHLNNCGNVTSRADGDWRRKLIEMKRPYKFSIAAENARFDGYVTEKLISSFQAHTVPIYWGNPSVAEEFNSKAFINANDLADEELIAEVRRIDEDDELWCRMIAEPPMSANQNDAAQKDAQKFVDFFKSVFDDRPIEQKKRAPIGYWNDVYRQSLARVPLDIWRRLRK